MIMRMRLFSLWGVSLGFFLLGCTRPEEYHVPWVKSGYQAASFVSTGSLSTERRLSVKDGDTLYALSRRYSVPLRLLIDANGLKPPYILQSGQTLRVPVARWHVVAPGETVVGIARLYKAEAASLAKRNNLRDPYVIRVGQTLMVTGQKSKSASARVMQKAPLVKPVPPKTRVLAKEKTYKSAKAPIRRSASKQKFSWPVQGKIVDSFGYSGAGRRNDGINIAVTAGTSIKASRDGIVVFSGKEIKSFGNLLLLKHDRGWMTAYAHASEILVKKGDRVRAGQAIARVGATGRVSSPQLHFEIRRGSQAVDPRKYL